MKKLLLATLCLISVILAVVSAIVFFDQSVSRLDGQEVSEILELPVLFIIQLVSCLATGSGFLMAYLYSEGYLNFDLDKNSQE